MNLAKLIFHLAMWLDRKHIEEYESDNGICGHYYSGHNGKYTRSFYREGDGQSVAQLPLLFGYKLISIDHSDEGYSWAVQKKAIL